MFSYKLEWYICLAVNFPHMLFSLKNGLLDSWGIAAYFPFKLITIIFCNV